MEIENVIEIETETSHRLSNMKFAVSLVFLHCYLDMIFFKMQNYKKYSNYERNLAKSVSKT